MTKVTHRKVCLCLQLQRAKNPSSLCQKNMVVETDEILYIESPAWSRDSKLGMVCAFGTSKLFPYRTILPYSTFMFFLLLLFIIASWVFSALTCVSNALMFCFLWFSPNIRPNPHSYPLRQLISWVVCFEVVFNSVFFQNSGPRHIRHFHSHQGHLEISGNIYNCHTEQDLLVFGEDGPRKLVNIPHTV